MWDFGPTSMPKPTVEEKYAYLLKHLKVVEIDWYENDAELALPKSIYFQFPTNLEVTDLTVDLAVEAAMNDWYRRSIGKPDGTD